ncbi:hypothetical protein AVEN_129900-1 [Araneus ventricosus]|uniref:Uncharacterized protein n=1 Tax=Araneus ventricosus TaxID=182803 RepID=A0A4Y2R0G9_ARAVE|nr:hypothetical protein AVEN_129900-1 [Araneus ventricosus]
MFHYKSIPQVVKLFAMSSPNITYISNFYSQEESIEMFTKFSKCPFKQPIIKVWEVHQSNETLKEREPTVEQFRHSLKKTVKGENDILNQDSPENEIFRWSILYHSLRPNNASSTETQVVIFLYDCELIFTSRSRRPRRIRGQHSLRSALPLPPGCFEAISHYSFQF